jgi:hypothetical protein
MINGCPPGAWTDLRSPQLQTGSMMTALHDSTGGPPALSNRTRQRRPSRRFLNMPDAGIVGRFLPPEDWTLVE